MKLGFHLLSAIALVAAACPVRAADEVLENLDTAKSAYQAGKLGETITALDYAGQLVRQKKGEEAVKLLPPPPSGWTAEDGTSESGGAAMMGGMVTVKRAYQRESGSRVTIQIQSDSPLMQSLGMMMSNPMLMFATGAKLETIKGQKCAITTSGSKIELKTLVDNRYIIEISGEDVKREDIVGFAKAIDYAKLIAL